MNCSPFRETDRTRGDRRGNRRFTLNLPLRYKVTRGKHLIEMGSGETRDISSGGISFTTPQALPPGAFAEIWLDWPMALNGNALRLVIHGRVVRSDEGEVAVQISRHEFRLAGKQAARAAAQGAVCAIGPPGETGFGFRND